MTPQPSSRPPLERMLRIHEEIRSGRFPNCAKLATELEISPKTVQRDIDFMRDRLGLPVAYHPTKYGFEYTEPVTQFPTLQVTEGEVLALFVARKALEQYRGTPFERPLRAAFQKITESLSEHVSFTAGELDSSISFRATAEPVGDLEMFRAVSKATLRSIELEFDYRKLGSAEREHRKVQPYHLACIENQWYLFAFDLDRKQLRTFVLGRMDSPEITARAFKKPADFDLSDYLSGSFGVFSSVGKKAARIRIRFDAFANQLIRERVWHPTQKIRDLPNGEIELEMRLSSLPDLERWILGWGPHAEVIEPDGLRETIRARLQEASAHYAKS